MSKRKAPKREEEDQAPEEEVEEKRGQFSLDCKWEEKVGRREEGRRGGEGLTAALMRSAGRECEGRKATAALLRPRLFEQAYIP